MSDPPRLLDRDSDSLGAELLRSGCDEQPSRGARDRTLAVIGASATLAATTTLSSGASGALTGAAAAAGVKAGFSSALLVTSIKWIAIGTVSSVAAVASVRHFSRAQEPERAANHIELSAAAVSSARSAVLLAPSSSAGIDVRPIDTPPVTAPAAPAPAPAPAPSARSAVPRSGSQSKAVQHAYPRPEQPQIDEPPAEEPAAPQETQPAEEPEQVSPELSVLKLEIARIDAARSAFQAGNFARTVTLLQNYERDFPKPKLHQELLFLRMASAYKLGNTALAKRLAENLVSSYPHGAHNALARAILGERSSQPKP